jgi:[NiFe] hydrogenase assembly HybE family chaperone
VLVTPWFINIVVLPGEGTASHTGDTIYHDLPAGRFPFIVGEEEGLGQIHSCSLFSPVFEFTDHAVAIETAKVALAEIMTGPELEKDLPENPGRRSMLGLNNLAGEAS